jgi:DNA-directed RNA polymerase specialized sigma24 family protein
MNPSDPWAAYARLQQQTDRRKLDPKAWAAEEQADAFLDALAGDALKADPAAYEAWLANLATNRAKKHRRRMALLHGYQRTRPDSVSCKAHDAAVHKESIERVRVSTTSEEWVALMSLASGEEYKSVATTQGCTESALKSRVLRCRRRVLLACA